MPTKRVLEEMLESCRIEARLESQKSGRKEADLEREIRGHKIVIAELESNLGSRNMRIEEVIQVVNIGAAILYPHFDLKGDNYEAVIAKEISPQEALLRRILDALL